MTQRQQHLWRCSHRHYNWVTCSESGTDFLNIRKTLSWTSAVRIVSVILGLHLLSNRLLAILLTVVGMLDRGLLILVITCRSATF